MSSRQDILFSLWVHGYRSQIPQRSRMLLRSRALFWILGTSKTAPLGKGRKVSLLDQQQVDTMVSSRLRLFSNQLQSQHYWFPHVTFAPYHLSLDIFLHEINADLA